MTETKDTAVCKGSYELGTACGECGRCRETQEAARRVGFCPELVVATPEFHRELLRHYAARHRRKPACPDLAEALREAQKREMTHRERWLQRVSFAYGNASLSDPAVTYEQVAKAAEALYGPCPEEE